MAEITKELGRISVTRGEYEASITYYKDNIVQYKRGSYQVVSESPIVGVPPTNDKNIVNPGWTLFAGTLDAQDVVNQIKEQEAKSIQAVAAREAEILAKSDAAEVSFNNTGTSLSGTNVQDALKETDSNINQLKNAGYLYAGIATPSTNPGTPEGHVFYIANGKGTYTNFGGIEVTEDEVVVLYYDKEWYKEVTGIASNDKVTYLSSEAVKTIAQTLTSTQQEQARSNIGISVNYFKALENILSIDIKPKDSEWIENSFINPNDGTIRIYTGHNHYSSYFIYVGCFVGKTLELNLASTVNTGCAWYAADKSFISGFRDNVAGASVVVVPDNAAYLRVTHCTNNMPFSSVVMTVDNTTNDVLKKIAETNERLSDDEFVLDEIRYKETNLNLNFNSEQGQYINSNTNGSLGYGGGNRKCTLDYYKVYKGNVISVFMYCDSNDCIALYDDKKKYVQKFNCTNTIKPTYITIPCNGYLRFSNNYGVITEPYAVFVNSKLNLEELNDSIEELKKHHDTELAINVEPGLLNATTGESQTFENANYRFCPEYFPVESGNIIRTNAGCLGYYAGICYYNANKQFISSVTNGSTLMQDYTVPDGAKYVRLCTERYTIIQKLNGILKKTKTDSDITELQYSMTEVERRVSDIEDVVDSSISKPYFINDRKGWIADETVKTFNPKSQLIEHRYNGQVTPTKRFIALGFDDFRTSDFSFIIPLFDKYGFKSEFNQIRNATTITDVDRVRLNNIIYGGHELGDHTWKHYKFPFDEPKFNGQDPDNPDGSGQTPFPSNSQLRDEVGNTGKNVFGIDLATPVSATISYQGPSINTPWGQLTDSDCQTIRNWFSVFKDTDSNLITLFDSLSNEYLGTTGSSVGSWDTAKGCYTGGIFTGCKTSENHEIWEKILMITNLFYKDKYGLNYQLKTWSLPGSKASQCYFNDFEHSNMKYYDENFTIPANNLARFESSYLKNNDGTAKRRSWTDVLNEFGYVATHDALYPGRIDGQISPCMANQMIMNAYLSRPNALPFSTQSSISSNTIANEYTKGTSLTGNEPYEVQMYDDGGSVYSAIETWRKNTANGIIFGEVIDSSDTWSERMILECLLKYCKTAGIEVITKAEAYDICFNHSITEGNLLYNPLLRNTAKEFLPTATTVPDNPDGFVGNCSVDNTDGIPTLITAGQVIYDHFGIPYGKIKFSADIKGTGSIEVRMIKNSTNIKTIATSSVSITTKNIVSVDDYSAQVVDFNIPLNELTEYEGLCAGYGEKVIGVRFVISSGLSIRNMCMKKV